jgi:hypothetical protein
MFDMAIDKYRRMMDLRRARYKHSLETDFPFLNVVYGDGYIRGNTNTYPYTLCLKVKEERINLPIDVWSYAKDIKYILKSELVASANNYIDSIYMFDDSENEGVRKRAMNSIDLLWSHLFKTTVPDGIDYEELLDRCISEIDRRTAGGPLCMYNSYSREYSGELPSAVIKCDLEIAGTSEMKHLADLKNDHERLAHELYMMNQERRSIWYNNVR